MTLPAQQFEGRERLLDELSDLITQVGYGDFLFGPIVLPEDEPCDFVFDKGWSELILKFVIRLTNVTGPLVVLPDTGDVPLLIGPTTRLSAVKDVWA